MEEVTVHLPQPFQRHQHAHLYTAADSFEYPIAAETNPSSQILSVILQCSLFEVRLLETPSKNGIITLGEGLPSFLSTW